MFDFLEREFGLRFTSLILFGEPKFPYFKRYAKK